MIRDWEKKIAYYFSGLKNYFHSPEALNGVKVEFIHKPWMSSEVLVDIYKS